MNLLAILGIVAGISAFASVCIVGTDIYIHRKPMFSQEELNKRIDYHKRMKSNLQQRTEDYDYECDLIAFYEGELAKHTKRA